MASGGKGVCETADCDVRILRVAGANAERRVRRRPPIDMETPDVHSALDHVTNCGTVDSEKVFWYPGGTYTGAESGWHQTVGIAESRGCYGERDRGWTWRAGAIDHQPAIQRDHPHASEGTCTKYDVQRSFEAHRSATSLWSVRP